MAMEFKAEQDEHGHIIVKPIIEKKGKDLIINVPSIPLIQKLKEEHDKRNIQ